MKKSLCVSGFYGELGWELFCWQGYLRKLSKKYNKTIVACRRGREILYQDFAEVIPLDVNVYDCDMWSCPGYKEPKDLFGETKGQIIKPPLIRYDHTHLRDKQPLFREFKNQEFIKYGNKNNDLSYDILIHSRNKKNKVNAGIKSNYRNWSKENWEKIFQSFPNAKIGCIGTTEESDWIDGVDLRNIPLFMLCDILASSKVLVSPSSGPVHLAALCGCPSITWYGSPYDADNHNRFLKDWNPFDTPCDVERIENWQIKPDLVIERIKKYVG